MSETLEYLRKVLEDRGITLPEKNLESAAATHDKLRHEFVKLNSVELGFLPPYIEPATAVRWIESYQDLQDDD
ncbi:MAG TPA: hypothetical protein VG872_04610 [Acidimicrobiia bacterium]|jgi:hypothetical protein|nr:hypothetical protein [Acidimicrobiia bacterium]